MTRDRIANDGDEPIVASDGGFTGTIRGVRDRRARFRTDTELRGEGSRIHSQRAEDRYAVATRELDRSSKPIADGV